jgi:hypothetical protein
MTGPAGTTVDLDQGATGQAGRGVPRSAKFIAHIDLDGRAGPTAMAAADAGEGPEAPSRARRRATAMSDDRGGAGEPVVGPNLWTRMGSRAPVLPLSTIGKGPLV